MVFETHGMSFPCTELLLFNYAKVNTVFHSMAPLTDGLEWCGSLVDYCDVFISCLDSHSDGTHSLQSIHWWTSDVMLHFSKSVLMKKKTHLHLGWPEVSANFHFWMNYSFKYSCRKDFEQNISFWLHWTHDDLNNNPCLAASRPDTHSHITSSQLIKIVPVWVVKKKHTKKRQQQQKMITCCLSLSDTYREMWMIYCFRLTNWMEKLGWIQIFLERHIMVNVCSRWITIKSVKRCQFGQNTCCHAKKDMMRW